MRHLEGAYALIFKSWHYPNELIACKLGSPLLLGVKVSNSLSLESRGLLFVSLLVSLKYL
jgi:glucosamine--fructose-6-phosphate aminotransferase (isomerizing)